jgi:cystathionine gamma-lyase
MTRLKTKSVSPKAGLGTRAIHAGQCPDLSTGAIMVPIYATETYVQKSPSAVKYVRRRVR